MSMNNYIHATYCMFMVCPSRTFIINTVHGTHAPYGNCTAKKTKNTVKMYIGEEIFGCTTGFLWKIIQISKLFSKYPIWQFISYNVLNTLKILVNYNGSCHYDILNDQDMIIGCYIHIWKISCHTEMVRNVNFHMQYFPKENPVKFSY